jgi:hypothetical protein
MGGGRRSLLSGEALVELEGRGGLEQRIIGWIVRSAGGRPQWQNSGGRDPCPYLAGIQSENVEVPRCRNLNGRFNRFL